MIQSLFTYVFNNITGSISAVAADMAVEATARSAAAVGLCSLLLL